MKLSWQHCILIALIAATGCSKRSASAPSSSDPVLVVVRAQADALNRKDLSAYMATIDPDSPAFASTKEMMEKITQAYDLRYTVKEATVESVNGDEARVRFDQITEKVSGPEFRNNEIKGVHTLKKRNGAWKVASTQIDKIDYLSK